MFRFDSRLLFVILSCGLLIVVLSCSQTDNVIAPKSLTEIWLSAERLPTPTPGMAYGLWVSKVAYPEITHASQVRLLGQFSYILSDTLVAFLEPDNTIRADSNEFTLEGDLFDFSHIFVTVEDTANIDTLPGPVMLMQSVTGNSDTIRMYFPQHDSLFESIIRCNFETPTDGNRYNADGYGLWFSSYELVRREITDTLSAQVSYVWDTIYPVIGEDGDTLNFATLYASYAENVWFEFDTVLVDFGRDTLALEVDTVIHYAAKQRIDYEVDSTIPRVYKNYDTGIHLNTRMQVVFLDVFTQDLFSMPDLSRYGWKYKGWVVHDEFLSWAPGRFSPPAWDFTSGELLIPGYQGGLITTGTFTDETDSDDSNPFTLEIPWAVDSGTFIDTVLKRPRFPGEDFLDSDSLMEAFGRTSVNLLPSPNNTLTGSVFVSIEPDNMVKDTTNFPLIAFCRRCPASWPVTPVGGAATLTLMNWTGYATGAKGFPKIEARIKRL